MMSKYKKSLCLSGAIILLGAGAALAEPTGGVITAGTGTVGPEIGQTTTIDQTSNRLAIEWQSFDVAANERVVFNQPGADAIALNRIRSGAPSTIAGQITANGRVFLINPDGIIFTSTANIDVNSLLATTQDIADSDFIAGNYDFSISGTPGAQISNAGSITADDAGLIAFVAPDVANSGLLQANLGKVVLAAGDAFTLDFFGDGLITFATGGTGPDQTGSVSVTGDILARDGAVILTATAARDFINTIINVEADLVASSATIEGGTIVLSTGDQGIIDITGTLNASGRDGGGIDIDGGEVYVSAGAVLNVNADQGMGDGGSISVRSRQYTEFAGLATAEPGSSSGVGGDILISSDNVLVFSGETRVGSGANAGTVTLSAGGGSTGGGSTGGGSSGGGSSGGGSTGGGSTGGGSAGGGSTGGGSAGGGPGASGRRPVVFVAAPIADVAATRISETASPIVFDLQSPVDQVNSEFASATVFFEGEVAYDFAPDSEVNVEAPDARLMCLHGVSENACGGGSP